MNGLPSYIGRILASQDRTRLVKTFLWVLEAHTGRHARKALLKKLTLVLRALQLLQSLLGLPQ